MKTLKRGKEIRSKDLIVVVLLPNEVAEKLVGRIVDCPKCELRGELGDKEVYATHEDGQYETIFIKCTNCQIPIKVDVIKSRRSSVA